jgi:hypothetical protein
VKRKEIRVYFKALESLIPRTLFFNVSQIFNLSDSGAQNYRLFQVPAAVKTGASKNQQQDPE